MIPISVIDNLTEEELALVLYVCNVLNPTSLEITPVILRTYRFKFLMQYLLAAQDKISEKGMPVYISTLNKLKIPVPECHAQIQA